MHVLRYSSWEPPESRMRIEYSTAVLRQLFLDSAKRDSSGVLFGTRRGNRVRIVEARERGVADEKETHPSGLDLVGIFAANRRGEIFLTESDLRRFERTALEGPKVKAAEDVATSENVALVVAGKKGGFFVRDNDGSIQTVQSYQEFPLVEPAPEPADNLPARRVPLQWSWVVLTSLAVMTMPAILSAMLRPNHGWTFSPAPQALAIQGNAEALRISWSPEAAGKNAQLEIFDGARYTAIPVTKTMSSVTYQPGTGDVEVRLTSADVAPRTGRAHFAGRLASYGAAPPSLDLIYAQIANLERELNSLHAALEARRTRVGALQNALQKAPRPRQPGGD